MNFQEIFVQYWDQVITGFIGGLVFYIMTQTEGNFFGVKLNLRSRWIRAIYAFLSAVLLVLIYSFLVFLGEIF